MIAVTDDPGGRLSHRPHQVLLILTTECPQAQNTGDLITGVSILAITILDKEGAAQRAVAEDRGNVAEIDPAGLEYSAFTSGLMIFQDTVAEDNAALDVGELVTTDAVDAIAELIQAEAAIGDVFVDVGTPAATFATAGFDPILTITEDSQAEIDVAAIF